MKSPAFARLRTELDQAYMTIERQKRVIHRLKDDRRALRAELREAGRPKP